MKIFNNIYELDSFKILYTNRILKMLQEIQTNNKDVLVITPLTKYQDILNFKKDNLLNNIFNQNFEDFREKLLNQSFINHLITKMNQIIGFKLLDANFEYEKIMKLMFELSNDFIQEKHLALTLELLNRFSLRKLSIVLAGFQTFNTKIYQNLDILYLNNNLQHLNLQFSNLELLWIDNVRSNKIFIVEDVNKLLDWIELKSHSVITAKHFENYLKGQEDYTSFLIEKSLLKITNLDL